MNLQVMILIPKYFGRGGWNEGKKCKNIKNDVSIKNICRQVKNIEKKCSCQPFR